MSDVIEKPKYEYGQQLFAAGYEATTERVACPECGGTLTLRCILWDGTEHVIDCVGCAAGFEPPRGHIARHIYHPCTQPAVISGVERRHEGGFEYRSTTSYIYREEQLFLTEAEAFACAQKMADDARAEELARIAQKEKPTRTWAWNVHYHRKCIRDAEKNIAYHTAKLNAATAKAKDAVNG